MSVTVLRDAFHGIVKNYGMRCTAARLRYVDADGVSTVHRDHQLLELDIVRAVDNASKTYTVLVPPGGNHLKSACDFALAMVVEPTSSLH